MYKVLIQKKDRGSQLGLTNCVLNDEFNPKIFDENYGYKPWYNYQEQHNKNLKEEMFLICKLRLINYEIRSLTKYYYAVSNDLKGVLEIFDIGFLECSLLNIVNTKGEKITNRDYSVIRFANDIIKSATNVLHQESYSIKDKRVQLKDVKIKDQVDYPMFKIKDIDETISCFFINSLLEEEIIKSTPCIGIDFVQIYEYPWSRTATFKYLKDANNAEPLILIN